MIRTIIIEDDYLVKKEFEKKLKKRYAEKVDILGTAADVESAVKLINELEPELIFLDIDLPDGTGFDILNKIDTKPITIMTTASSEYGIEAVNRGVNFYLVKPVENKLLDEAVNKIESLIIKSEFPSSDYISLSTSDGVFRLHSDDITYCKSDGNYSTFYTKSGKKIMISKPSKVASEKLNYKQFVRISQSIVVNINFISRFDREGYLHIEDGTTLRVSGSYKAKVRSLLT